MSAMSLSTSVRSPVRTPLLISRGLDESVAVKEPEKKEQDGKKIVQRLDTAVVKVKSFLPLVLPLSLSSSNGIE